MSTTQNEVLDLEIGPYKPIEILGQGGMGIVYLARRVDGEMEQKAAVKLIKRGMDSEEAIRRFREERQILAHLDHPNIARLLDGGTLEDGRPYLVMEYVDGLPLDKYCSQHKLNLEERLRLLAEVCRAIQFAHNNLIVHRDIKPGNVLVTSEGQIKLLDFGIACVLDFQGTASSADTLGSRAMTLDFASPEQIAGKPVTTLSDIYSLGTLSYVILTGVKPHRGATTEAEKRRTILEEAPEPPSKQVTRQAGTHSLTSLPVEDYKRLADRLSGDLDRILLMALRKEPERRYASAEQMAEDIEAHLAGYPIIAAGDTYCYRVRKFVGRHRLALASIVLVTSLLLALLVQLLVERRETALALANAEEKAEVSRKVINYFAGLFDLGDQAAHKAETITANDLVRRGVENLEVDLGDQPKVHAALARTLGSVLGGLDQHDISFELLERSLALEQVHSPNSHALADAHYQLGLEFLTVNDFKNAELNFRASKETLQALYPEGSSHVTFSMVMQGRSLLYLGQSIEAEKVLTEALEIQKRFPTNYRRIAATHENICRSLYLRGAFEECETHLLEALRYKNESYPQHSVPVAFINRRLGELYLSMSQFDKAAQYLGKSVEIMRIIFPGGHLNRSVVLNSLAEVRLQQRHFKQARELLLEARPALVKTQNGRTMDMGYNHVLMGLLHAETGDMDQALEEVKLGFEVNQEVLGPGNIMTCAARRQHAVLLNELGHSEQALFLMKENLAHAAKRQIKSNRERLTNTIVYADILISLERGLEAETTILDSLSLVKDLPTSPQLTVQLKLTLAMAMHMREAWQEAEPIIDGCIKALQQHFPGEHPTYYQADVIKARNLIGQGQMEKARPLLNRAIAYWEDQPHHGFFQKAQTLRRELDSSQD